MPSGASGRASERSVSLTLIVRHRIYVLRLTRAANLPLLDDIAPSLERFVSFSALRRIH
jgi:hypothetical protein